MPLPAMLSGLLVEQAADAVVKALKLAYSKAPWARDGAVAHTVERKIHLLIERVAELARNVPPENLEALSEPLIRDFRSDLVDAKISEADANDIVNSVRSQIRTTVLQPLQDVSALQARLKKLEDENLEQDKRLKELDDLRATAAENDRRVRGAQATAVVAVTLAAVSMLLCLLAWAALLMSRR